MNRVLPVILIFLINSINSQDLTNRYISKVKFRMSYVYNHLPTSVCNPEDWGNNEEWRFKAQVSDSPNEDGLGWTNDGCYMRSYEGSGWSTTPDFEFYEHNWTNPNKTSMDYSIRLYVWEDDINPDCELQNGDQCEWSGGPISHSYLDLPKNDHCPNTWNSWYSYLGNTYRYINIEYFYEVDTDIGTGFSNTFNFVPIDDVNGCFSAKKACLSTAGRSSNYVYFKFNLTHTRSIQLDYTSLSSIQLYNSSQAVISPNSSPTGSNIYYNLSPGTYYIKTYRSTDGLFEFEIKQASTTLSNIPHLWNGSYSENWFEACNWSTNHVPDKNNDVYILNTSNKPRIYSTGNSTPDNAHGYAAGKAYCNSLDVESGSIITIESSPFGTAELRVNHP